MTIRPTLEELNITLGVHCLALEIPINYKFTVKQWLKMAKILKWLYSPLCTSQVGYI